MRKQIIYLIVINSFFVFAINMFAPLYAAYVQNIDNAVINVGGIWSFYIFGVGIFTYFVSKSENRLKYADSLVIGFLFRIVGWTGYIFSYSVLHLYLIQVFLALGEAFGSPSYNSLFSTHLEKGKFTRAWGLGISINSIVTGIASFIGSLIVVIAGFKTLFIIMIGMSLVSTVLALRYRDLMHLK